MRYITRFVVLISLIVLWSCGSEPETRSRLTDEPERKETAGEDVPEEVEKPIAVVSLCETSLREQRNGEFKWTSNKLVYLQAATTFGDTMSEKGKEYMKVTLKDGSQGWVNTWCLAVDAKRGVVTSKVSLYGEPDIMAISSKTIDALEYVVVMNEQVGDYQEVIYKEGDKRKKGWIKGNSTSVSFEEVDLAVATLLNQANALEGDEKATAIQNILDNSDYAASTFYKMLEMKATVEADPVDDLEAEMSDDVYVPEEAAEEEIE